MPPVRHPLTPLRSPVWNDILAIISHHIERTLTGPCVEEPTNVVCLEELTVVVECLPVIGVLGNSNISVTSCVAVIGGPSPLCLYTYYISLWCELVGVESRV
jgi:hypothetical protein